MDAYTRLTMLPKVQELLAVRSLHRALRAKGYFGVDGYKGRVRLLRLELACLRAQRTRMRATWTVQS